MGLPVDTQVRGIGGGAPEKTTDFCTWPCTGTTGDVSHDPPESPKAHMTLSASEVPMTAKKKHGGPHNTYLFHAC